MEINITDLWRYMAPHTLRNISGSQAEHGPLAAQITWDNAQKHVVYLHPLSFTLAQFEALDTHFAAYGAWADEERAEWTVEHLLALLVQEVASDAREAGLDSASTAKDWERYFEDETCSGTLSADFTADSPWPEIHFYVGH